MSGEDDGRHPSVVFIGKGREGAAVDAVLVVQLVNESIGKFGELPLIASATLSPDTTLGGDVQAALLPRHLNDADPLQQFLDQRLGREGLLSDQDVQSPDPQEVLARLGWGS